MKFGAGIGLALILVALAGVVPARAGSETHEDDAGAVPAGKASASSRTAITVNVTRTSEGYEVDGRCTTTASRAAMWNVLTDYDGIDGFVSSMKESKVTQRADGHLLVEQTAVGRLLFFSRRMTVVLFVHEEPEAGVIQFEDVLLHDFAAYRGEWRIEEHDGRRELLYHVTARPSFRVPDVVARGMFGRTVRDLLAQVEAEMVRRAALASAVE